MRVATDADVRLFAIPKSSSVLRELPAFIENMTNSDAAACQGSQVFVNRYVMCNPSTLGNPSLPSGRVLQHSHFINTIAPLGKTTMSPLDPCAFE